MQIPAQLGLIRRTPRKNSYLVMAAILFGGVVGGACGSMPPGPAVSEAATAAPLSKGFGDIVKKVTPAVVNIAVTGGEQRREGPRRRPLPQIGRAHV